MRSKTRILAMLLVCITVVSLMGNLAYAIGDDNSIEKSGSKTIGRKNVNPCRLPAAIFRAFWLVVLAGRQPGGVLRAKMF